MEKKEIVFGDWHRLLFGEAPALFVLEVLIRTVLMYFVLLVVLRLLGKRMGGQLTISELAVMLTLGAIISLPMQAPEKGLLQGLIVLGCALAFQRGVNFLGFKHAKVEKILQGRETILVKDGALVVQNMRDTRISNQQLFALLRSKSIFNLGAVERVYLEASGLFSIYQYPKPRSGLSLLPTDDLIVYLQNRSFDTIVCKNCGKTFGNQNRPPRCTECQHQNFIFSII